MKAFITKDCFTDHGGKIDQGDDSWIVEGKAVHLEGMTHYCPKCGIMSKAIATGRGFILVNGRNIIVAGDISTCGARYMKISDLIVRDTGSGIETSKLKLIRQQKMYSAQYQLVNEVNGTPYKNVKYKITYDDGNTVEGTTDNEGMTEKLDEREQMNSISIEISENDSW